MPHTHECVSLKRWEKDLAKRTKQLRNLIPKNKTPPWKTKLAKGDVISIGRYTSEAQASAVSGGVADTCMFSERGLTEGTAAL